MTTPDMSDVTRIVNTDDPAPEVIERAQQTVEISRSMSSHSMPISMCGRSSTRRTAAITSEPHQVRRVDDVVGGVVVSSAHSGLRIAMLPAILPEYILAAIPLAEHLADEHNTTHQDREEGDQHGE